MYFGLKDAPPPPAEREAQAAARRATGGQRAAQSNTGGPTNQPGISGLAIDQQDRIYVFNRGPKPVMVFNTAGQMVLSGADQVINGKAIEPELAALGHRGLGRQRLRHRARRAPHRQAQPEAGHVPDAARERPA